MSNILLAKVQIVGVRRILWHAFTVDAIPLTKIERAGVAGNDPSEWRRTVLLTAEQQLYIRNAAVFSCLRAAARFTRRGRSTIQLALAATLQVAEERVLVDQFLPDEIGTDTSQEVYLDIQSVVNPTTRGRNVRYRVAAAAGWRSSFSLIFDKTIVSRNEMEAVTLDAGRLVGLGSGRTLGYGRFAIAEFTLVEMVEAAVLPYATIEHE